MRKNKKLGVNSILIKRVLAFLIDFLILNMLIAFPFNSIIRKIIPDNRMYGLSDLRSLMYQNEYAFGIYAIIGIILVLSYFYFVLFEYLLGQTIGKIILDLKVVNIKDVNKKEMDFHPRIHLYQVIIRSLFLIPIFPFSILIFIDPLYLFIFSKKGQRLTERMSNTQVVEVKY